MARRTLTAERRDREPRLGVRGRAAQDARADGHQRRLVIRRRGARRCRRPRRNVVARCFPMAAAWPGRTTFADLAHRQLRRRDAALALPEPPPGREARLPDPGFARFRGDGEAHLFSPKIAGEIQALARSAPDGAGRSRRPRGGARHSTGARSPGPPTARAVPRDELRVRRAVADPARRCRARQGIVRGSSSRR